MTLNMNINSKIIDLMDDLVRIRDDSVVPQNLSVFLAKTTKKDKNLPADSANIHRRPQISSERSESSSTSEVTDNIRRSRLPNRSTVDLNHQLNNTRNISRNATTHSSQLPPTLENPNEHVSRLPRMVSNRKTDPKKIAERIQAQCSNAKLTTDERDALISRVLTSQLEIQSKFDAQAKELFLSPKTKSNPQHATPDRKDTNQLMASLMKKRLKIESKRAAQERLIFSADEQEMSETVSPPAGISKPNAHTSRSRPRETKKKARPNFGRSLTPIPEASELRSLDLSTGNEDDERNYEEHNRHNMENLWQKQMESELPSELIEDTSLLLQSSDESDSLDELVIKDFAIRIVESEPDAVTSSLPITEQVMLESNKLKEMIESVKDRFQVKIARDKFAERSKQKNHAPNIRASVSARPAQGKIEQTFDPIAEIDKPTSSRTVPINILDSYNWGNVALPKPIFEDVAEPGSRSSDEDFLRERDMQFDDLFGADNISEPLSLKAIPQYEPQIPNKIVGRTQRQYNDILNSTEIENIEDLESPQFSDLPSDVSVRSDPPDNLNTSGNHFEDPQYLPDIVAPHSDYHPGTPNDSASRQSKIDFQRPNQQQRERIDSTVETEHEKDIKKLKELIDSGALTSSIVNQRFEEGVLDLLLRQSDSLWDPIVAGIPILYFIPSQNNERGLLDTSIKEKNLESPLIKRPETKLPGYMESLENGWTTNTENGVDDAADIDMGVNNNNVVDEDENVLVHGLPPTFSYEPQNVPEYLYRKNIMDRKDEPDDGEDMLDDREMNIDDLFDNAAQPTYDFQKAKIMDDLEIKMKIIRRMTEKSDVASTNSGMARKFELRTDQSPPTQKNPVQRTTQNQSEREGNTVNIRKSVSFAGSGQDNESSTHGSNVRSETARTPQENRTKSGEIKRWTTLDISEVKDLIEHARLAQAKHKGSRN